MEAQSRALVADRPSGKALRMELERLAHLPYCNQFSWLWGPYVWERLREEGADRLFLRSFLLGHVGLWSMNGRGRSFDPWKKHPPLLAWLAQVEEAGDVELFRSLLRWRMVVSWPATKLWRAELRSRLAKASGRIALSQVLARFDVPAELDEETALEVYRKVGPSSRRFLLAHQPWRTTFWTRLFDEAQRQRDDDTAFELYRHQVEPARWKSDVRAVMRRVADPSTLLEELERRHPRTVRGDDAGALFLELLEARGSAVLPYVLRHAASVTPRQRFFGKKETRGVVEMIALAEREAWLPLWARLLQTSATPELWNETVRRLLERPDRETLTVRQRLAMLPGTGRELSFGPLGLVQLRPLTDDVACLMLRRAPELLRSAYRMHLPLSAWNKYEKLTAAALAAVDEELVDYLASRAAMDVNVPHTALADHFERLPVPDGTFARRAAHALSMMPAFAIWSYEQLLEKNRLARLLFERSTPLYLAEPALLRDLLESPQIHVQLLALRVLASDDGRATSAAAASLDLLAATLLRPLHRRSRLLAFAAMERAARDPDAARLLLPRLREALALPERGYPKEALVGLIGRILHRHPPLRGPREEPLVHARTAPTRAAT